MTPHLTDAGKNLLLRALAGETITFTKMQLGSGAAQTADNAAALKNPVVSLPLTSIEVGNEYVTLSSYFSNSSLTEGFRVTEMGIFAKDPDDTSDATKEILYAIGNSSVNDADYIPAKTDRIYEVQLDTLVFVGDVENITATINGSLVYASAGDLSDHIGNKNNPHEVTKAQVGLGSVPNVTTNDQTPTYTEAASVSNISSGEKLSAAFGKIKMAISALISHLNAKDNPHEVTAAQVGAAAAEHEHPSQPLYMHTIVCSGTGASGSVAKFYNCCFSFINSVSSAYTTFSAVSSALHDFGADSFFPASGTGTLADENNLTLHVYCVYVDAPGTSIRFSYIYGGNRNVSGSGGLTSLGASFGGSMRDGNATMTDYVSQII